MRIHRHRRVSSEVPRTRVVRMIQKLGQRLTESAGLRPPPKSAELAVARIEEETTGDHGAPTSLA